MRTVLKISLLWALLSIASAIEPHAASAADGKRPIAFPAERPSGGSFSRPVEGEISEVSPPGFCWWRAAARGKAKYRLKVSSSDGQVVYESPLLGDPVHVPDRVFPAGRFSWTVEAVDAAGKVVDVLPPRGFEVSEAAFAQPWVRPEELLARVPREHPRLLFPKGRLDEIRATLETSRREAFGSLRRQADAAVKLEPPPEPDYDEIKDPGKRRLGYVASYHTMRRYHNSGMVHLALMYLLTGEAKYGEPAAALLVDAARWDPEGISSVMAPYGDEVGLGLAKSGALAYDWLYELLTPDQRALVEKMLVARADQMLRRLQRRDFLNRSETSHDGRLPGYLLEHAIALAEHPRAAVWMDYALRTIMTVFPHWGGQDGGWAEGLSYGLAYNSIFITPFESMRIATGLDIWQRPFYRKLPYFFFYNVSPLGEIMGFGDSYDGSASGRAGSLRGLLQFHAERHRDPTIRWWVDLLRTSSGGRARIPALVGLIQPETAAPKPPVDVPPDAVFRGVGWAALHGNLARPEEDLFVAFKSSPYGPVSHSYADQNSFAILQGGKALARPGGSRYPQHGTPFHTKYTQQTVAQNAILVDGQGQTSRKAWANGRIVGFESTPHLGYVCGDAEAAYSDRLNRCLRHVLLVRPSLVVVIDDLAAPEQAEFQWLLHASEKFELDEPSQTLVSRRGSARMKVHLVTPDGCSFSQTDAWPLDPKTGFPTAKRREPTKLWHFTATSRERARARRIAAVMVVSDGPDETECEVRSTQDGVEARLKSADAETVLNVDLSADPERARPILEVQCRPKDGEVETLSVN